MIQSLKLKDFQAHEELEVAFSQGVTTIRGPSDRGKSSILRALRWVCLNDLPGDEFIREGAKRTEVELRVKGKKIRRGKGGAAGNTYELGADDEYKSFGTSVPEPIAKLLPLSELNFQGQHDAPFWFSESAPEVSRQLNAIIDLSVIDTSLGYIGAIVRQEEARLIYNKEDLQKIVDELEEVEKERPRIEDFQELLELEKKLERRRERREALFALLEKVKANRAEELRERLEDQEKVLRAAWAAIQAIRNREDLTTILASIEELKVKAVPPPDFTPVTEARVLWLLWRDKAEKLLNLLSAVRAAQVVLEAKNKVAQEAKERFYEKTQGEKCPLCGNTIN